MKLLAERIAAPAYRLVRENQMVFTDFLISYRPTTYSQYWCPDTMRSSVELAQELRRLGQYNAHDVVDRTLNWMDFHYYGEGDEGL